MTSQMEETELTQTEEEDSQLEDSEIEVRKTRGRQAGKADSSQRSRHTAAEISEDKSKIASMKLEAMKEMKLCN